MVFTFNNLWETDVEQSFFLPSELASTLALKDDVQYRLVNVLDGTQAGSCQSGADLKSSFYVRMARGERLQWLRLELCH